MYPLYKTHNYLLNLMNNFNVSVCLKLFDNNYEVWNKYVNYEDGKDESGYGKDGIKFMNYIINVYPSYVQSLINWYNSLNNDNINLDLLIKECNIFYNLLMNVDNINDILGEKYFYRYKYQCAQNYVIFYNNLTIDEKNKIVNN